MKNIFIYHQTQIGDHIVCYSIAKHYAKLYDRVFIIAHNLGERHQTNLGHLYSTLKNVGITFVDSHSHALNFISSLTDECLVFGHSDYITILRIFPDTQFDKYFYESAKVPFNAKWDDFCLVRNIDQEKHLFFNVFNLKDNEEFVFLHEDESRNYIIDKKYVDNSIKIIKPSDFPNVNIFDFLYTIEKAKEVHTINSSFLSLVDILQFSNNKLYYHSYVRPSKYEQPHLRLNWNIIK